MSKIVVLHSEQCFFFQHSALRKNIFKNIRIGNKIVLTKNSKIASLCLLALEKEWHLGLNVVINSNNYIICIVNDKDILWEVISSLSMSLTWALHLIIHS